MVVVSFPTTLRPLTLVRLTLCITGVPVESSSAEQAAPEVPIEAPAESATEDLAPVESETVLEHEPADSGPLPEGSLVVEESLAATTEEQPPSDPPAEEPVVEASKDEPEGESPQPADPSPVEPSIEESSLSEVAADVTDESVSNYVILCQLRVNY